MLNTSLSSHKICHFNHRCSFYSNKNSYLKIFEKNSINQKVTATTLRLFTRATFPYSETKLNNLSVFDVSLFNPYTIITVVFRSGLFGESFIKSGPSVSFHSSDSCSFSRYGRKLLPDANARSEK